MENIKKLFNSRYEADSRFNVRTFVDSLSRNISSAGSDLTVDTRLVERVAQEDFDKQDVRDAVQSVYDSVSRELVQLGFESYNADRGQDAGRITENQTIAATMGLIGSQNESAYKKALLATTKAVVSNEEFVRVSRGLTSGASGNIAAFSENISLENYNEKSQRDFRVITAGFNLSSSRQDAFAEAVYRTSLVTPQEGGAVQIVPYVALLKDRYHEVTGQVYNAEEVNLVDAYRDPSILDDASIDLIPAIKTGSDGNSHLFVAAADLAYENLVDEKGNAYQTSSLKFGVGKFDLIGVSNKSLLVSSGLLDISDTIDPAGSLEYVDVKVAGNGTEASKVIRFNVSRMPQATFVPSLVDNTRLARVNFESSKIKIKGTTRTVDGATMAAVTTIATNDWTIELNITVHGSIDLARGTTSFTSDVVTVARVLDANGNQIDTSTGSGAALLTELGALTPLGYKTKTRFTNTNRRMRGNLLQTRAVQFRYPIWMHSPITLPLSTLDEQGPGEVAHALTVASDIRNSANAVTALLNYVAQLKDVVGSGSAIGEFGDVEGALSIMMRPTYRYFNLDFTGTTLDTIRSGDRWVDVCAALLNTIKSLLFPAYRDSNIESVFQTVSGNVDERPLILILTDREIANYLNVVGDVRTLGAYLKYEVVATNNKKMDGKIIVIPTRENPTEDDILNWGQFFFVPTIVGDLPISRDGQISREICAIPFNRHVNNIPFALEIDVSGLTEVMSTSRYNVLL